MRIINHNTGRVGGISYKIGGNGSSMCLQEVLLERSPRTLLVVVRPFPPLLLIEKCPRCVVVDC